MPGGADVAAGAGGIAWAIGLTATGAFILADHACLRVVALRVSIPYRELFPKWK